MNIELLPHQHDFVTDTTTRYLGLIGGYGSGKTWAFCMKGIHLASLNVDYQGALLEPINSMLSDTLIPEFERAVQECGIAYTYKATPLPTFKLKFRDGDTTILMRSAENYRRLAGLNLAFFGIDEADTIDKDTATKMWRMCQSRLRRGNVYQGFTTSTPEGFGFLYEFFEAEKKRTDRRYISARTADNPFLPEGFIESLIANYPKELVEAYLNGQFVNMVSGNVYKSFDRRQSHTNFTVEAYPDSFLHVGVDFNIGHTCGIISVVDKNEVMHVVDEIVEQYDTEALIGALKNKYDAQRIIVYPDASGKKRTTNAAMSDIALLKQAGFQLRYKNGNPVVKDRVTSVNTRLCNAKGERKLFVNTILCPSLTKSLEQQGWVDGAPDKDHNLDHVVDALGYNVYYNWPILPRGTLRQYG